MKYAKLDKNGEKVRNWSEINNIKLDFDHYRLTGNQEYVQQYLIQWESLTDLLIKDGISTKSLAVAYWDDLHPLSEQDKKIYGKIMRKKLVDDKIFS